MSDLDFLAPGWRRCIGAEFEAPYMGALRAFLQEERNAGRVVYPPKGRIFAALRQVDFEDVRVVVLGQDPYHGPGQALGMSFAVPNSLAIPPSLRNIFKEVSADMGSPVPQCTDLSGWAEQGVLLLNTVLTVRAGEAFSHRKRGWETLTDKIIEALGARKKPMVFLFVGSPSAPKSTSHLQQVSLDTQSATSFTPVCSPWIFRMQAFFTGKRFFQSNWGRAHSLVTNPLL
jgi:uracil-DNA glycosylase